MSDDDELSKVLQIMASFLSRFEIIAITSEGLSNDPPIGADADAYLHWFWHRFYGHCQAPSIRQ